MASIEDDLTGGLPDQFDPGEYQELVFSPRIRSLSLDLLDVRKGDVVWEVGAGTGSVSLESATAHPHADYHAIEQNSDHYNLLEKNILECDVSNVIPHHGHAPYVFDQLPSPDKIFLGGTGGRPETILRGLNRRFDRGNRLVASLLDRQLIRITQDWLSKHQFSVDHRTVRLGGDEAHARTSPSHRKDRVVYLLKAKKDV